MNILYPFLISFLAGISTIIGFLFIFIRVRNKDRFISISLSFSASIMILISIFDLIPNSFFSIIQRYRVFGFILIIFSFLLGYFVIALFEKITKYLEYKNSSLYKLGILSSIVLILHNIPEGIITFLTSSNDIYLGLKISIAIALHNIPEGICIAVPIYYSTRSYIKSFLITFISGISELFGAILAYILLYRYVTVTIINIIFIFVAGLMISLSINDILKESFKYSRNNNKYLYIGFVIAIILFILSMLLHV